MDYWNIVLSTAESADRPTRFSSHLRGLSLAAVADLDLRTVWVAQPAALRCAGVHVRLVVHRPVLAQRRRSPSALWPLCCCTAPICHAVCCIFHLVSARLVGLGCTATHRRSHSARHRRSAHAGLPVGHGAFALRLRCTRAPPYCAHCGHSALPVTIAAGRRGSP